MQRQPAYNYDELIACGEGKIFGPGNGRLPLPPMLMFDRITRVSESGGKYDKGEIIAELDIRPDLWFFECHFQGDPVMPGCLGLDAMWQLLGFYLCWLGHPGRGRALAAGNVKFTGEIVPETRKVVYKVSIKRVRKGALVMGMADAALEADGKLIYEAEDLRVGLFGADRAL